MKLIVYYLTLLILIALLTGFLLAGKPASMSMPQMLSASLVLILYSIALSLVGEGGNKDEREISHRNLANRAGLVAGTAVFTMGILYQLFITHKLDWWLPGGLIAINLTKIIYLIYLEKNK